MAYYDRGLEDVRLTSGPGLLEQERTRELLRRYLPAALGPGGRHRSGSGRVQPLAGRAGLHGDGARPDAAARRAAAQAASRRGLVGGRPRSGTPAGWTCRTGRSTRCCCSVRSTTCRTATSRLQALREAARIVAPGGVVLAVAISRWAVIMDGVLRLRLGEGDPGFAAVVDTLVADRPDGPAGARGRSAGLRASAGRAAGRGRPRPGCGSWRCCRSRDRPPTSSTWRSAGRRPAARDLVLDVARRLEAVPELAGMGPHLMLVAERTRLSHARAAQPGPVHRRRPVLRRRPGGLPARAGDEDRRRAGPRRHRPAAGRRLRPGLADPAAGRPVRGGGRHRRRPRDAAGGRPAGPAGRAWPTSSGDSCTPRTCRPAWARSGWSPSPSPSTGWTSIGWPGRCTACSHRTAPSVHVHATTHRGIETDAELPLPSPPYAALDELSRRYVAPPPPRSGGPGRSGESDVYRAAGFPRADVDHRRTSGGHPDGGGGHRRPPVPVQLDPAPVRRPAGRISSTEARALLRRGQPDRGVQRTAARGRGRHLVGLARIYAGPVTEPPPRPTCSAWPGC